MDENSEQREPESEREETLEDLDVPEDVAEDTKGGRDSAIKCG